MGLFSKQYLRIDEAVFGQSRAFDAIFALCSSLCLAWKQEIRPYDSSMKIVNREYWQTYFECNDNLRGCIDSDDVHSFVDLQFEVTVLDYSWIFVVDMMGIQLDFERFERCASDNGFVEISLRNRQLIGNILERFSSKALTSSLLWKAKNSLERKEKGHYSDR